ncbi:glutamate synthase large subunit [Psychrobium sp. 1_MG-2023]|uniref:glutamate synthase large subunit n=1 Tax=Psychrobium sp. 1_MG-2023 TaxID=3062624 RepID=UPI000C3370C5|nr:glutamate synthase large subunit [Psychrobium sp. 1_MG-2023]MDP2560963.1 glutamate synthase large subunit [Psychrobium sp. 1_MG-2023]PKF56035.1 glutamate synthase large subunit [Alteromonadales bacterium alter-6D02]
MALTSPSFEKDNCGFGLIAQMDGNPSHKIIRTAIEALDRMQHRGGISADGITGDGCGLLMQAPEALFQAVAKENNWSLSKKYAVGMCFLNTDPLLAQQSRKVLTEELEKETMAVVGWREVPINKDILGPIALDELPVIEQVFVNAPAGWISRDIERRLYMARRRAEKRLTEDKDFYIASLSSMVTIYKGLVKPVDLPSFYLDLADLRTQSSICLFHQRFSTNTSPKWPLAQPFRFLAHNGEINTIAGNRQWAKARSYKFKTPLLPDLQDAAPFVSESGSDSSSLDNMLELLLMGGMDLYRSMRMLIPPAWQSNPTMDDELRAFYDFNSMHMEPWDGPAGVVMTNGRHAACAVDRNGLRPARYVVTKDRILTLASEVGIWDYQPDEVAEKGRVGPGELLVVDTYTGKLTPTFDIDNDLKSRHPYSKWLANNSKRLVPFSERNESTSGHRSLDDDKLAVYQKQFNYSKEEIHDVLNVMGRNGQEVTASMGDDAPMAVLSRKQRSVFDYFRQKFAQVTNPAIDPLREAHTMSLATCIGSEQNLFKETLGHAHRVLFKSPVLVYSDLEQLRNLEETHYSTTQLSMNYDPAIGLEQAINELCDKAQQASAQGAVIIILSDRDISKDTLPIPAAMAAGAVQQRLVNNNLRCDTNIIVETAAARDPHHFAVLLGFGVTAIYPYLAYETLLEQIELGKLTETPKQAVINYQKAIDKGLMKIMSKMGISTVASYRCAQLFEAVGLADSVVELCFTGVTNRIKGADFEDFAYDQQVLNNRAYRKREQVEHGGLLKFDYRGEYHCFNPDVVQLLQTAVKSGKYSDYQAFAKAVNERPVATIRDLLALRTDQQAIDISEVESADKLFPRFDSAAMSIGALSPEAHTALAVAMNRLGGQSNSGEGGEDPSRFNSERNSKIKQIASGRFGVTAHYLMNAEVLQIKVAQGAKPGEGGQLPGDKVSAEIAGLRYSTPGVTLISPPPHHDIYSIEDLAQLIFDLKQINPKALISVKLVSEPGIGTIATGVAKAYADLITVSGYDGGTGASPLTSVKYAGSPWELGLAEVQQALVENGLRHKVRLQVDGGLKTGLDVIKGAILGAESFGFGTAPMVALGCKYLRICHLNNCATGVATQNEELRDKHFKGLPEMVSNYFEALAQDIREILAGLGIEKLTDLIGRTDLLEVIEGQTPRQSKLDLSDILYQPQTKEGCGVSWSESNPAYDEGLMNKQLSQLTEQAIKQKAGGEFNLPIRNTDRSVGASISGEIARHHGNQGMSEAPIQINFTGTAGQSFGVWNAGGLNMTIVGDANDYVGKGMTGGQLIVHPPHGVAYKSHEASIVGNTCLYGATGGKLFAAGQAGERFGVRNSGAITVVEGMGDNGCEYMTGGVVVSLGDTGVNFAAGMTGGFAYLLDEHENINERMNHECAEALPLEYPAYQAHLKSLIEEHFAATGSERARNILDNFEEWLPKFLLVKPTAADLTTMLPNATKVLKLAVNAG